MTLEKIIIGGRSSILSKWQMNFVKNLLPNLEIEFKFISTRGDRVQDKPLPEIGGKGVFTEEIQKALKTGDIDCAVHSLKDLPVQNPEGLTLCAIPERGPTGDVLISKNNYRLSTLPKGALIGTSSVRRQAQLLKARPDLKFKDLRGNIDTRVNKKLHQYDAILAAHAGIVRAQFEDRISEVIDPNIMIPAPGQGAMAVECAKNRQDIINLFKPLNNIEAVLCTTAERAFLEGLGAGCSLPLSAHASIINGEFILITRINNKSGTKALDLSYDTKLDFHDKNIFQTVRQIGLGLAESAIENGANKLLA